MQWLICLIEASLSFNSLLIAFPVKCDCLLGFVWNQIWPICQSWRVVGLATTATAPLCKINWKFVKFYEYWSTSSKMGNVKRNQLEKSQWLRGTIARASIVGEQIKRQQQNNWRNPKPCWFQQDCGTFLRGKQSCWQTSKSKRHRQRGEVRVYSCVQCGQKAATQILMINTVGQS